MKREYSCGAVVYTKVNGEYRYVIIRSRGGDFGFAKGHMEEGESEQQTAVREVREEIGLNVTLHDGFRMVDEYQIPSRKQVYKQVVYFLGYYEKQRIVPQLAELVSARLMSFNEAMTYLTFPRSQEILLEAANFLKDPNVFKVK